MTTTPETNHELSPAKRKLYELLRARRQAEDETAAAVTITPVDRRGPLPLSFSQQRMWFVDYLAPGNPAYNVPGALGFEGPLSVAALAASLDALIARHETLRTRFVAEGGQPRQEIRRSLRLSLPVVDLGALPAARSERLVHELAVADNRRPYRLAEGPLLRAQLLRLGAGRHVLLVNMHHIIADNWTIALFVQETAELYEALVEGRPSRLPALPFQYADFAVWQRQQLSGAALEVQTSYWLEQLGGELPVLEIATDRPRPAVASWRGARHYLDVSPEVTAELRALARRESTTPFVVGLAAFNLLLHRYTGATDLPVGTTAAGRRHSGLESLLGLFMNLLVLRGDLEGAPGGRELIRRFQALTVAALAHQDVPFEQVVERLRVARDLSRPPIFQFQFNLQPASAQTLERAGVRMTPIFVDSGTARFDMEMILWDHLGGLKGYMEYNVDLFDATSLNRLGRGFLSSLRRLVRDPDAALDRLIGLDEIESHQLLSEWNDTRSPVLARDSILPAVAAVLCGAPDAVALACEDACLSYGELDRRTCRLAHLLHRRNAGPGAVVGVSMERCPELVVALVGVLRAGAAYLPLDLEDPAERLRFLAADAGAALVLFRAGAPRPELGIDAVAVGGDLSGNPETAPPFAARAADAAYVIYTSGSTGRPKGVVSCHGGLANRLCWMQEAFALTPRDRVLQKTSFTFDVSVWEFFWPLMTGARLVLARPGGHRDPSYLAGLVAAREITTVHFVPSMLRIFLEAPEAAACAILNRAVLSGEALPSELARQFAEILPGTELHNLYGPTEASIDVTAHRDRPGAAARPTVAIGRPIANTAVGVFDAALRPVPLGRPGELGIAGTGLARGYLGRPALTARAFVPEPGGAELGARLYRTGDLVRRLADGEIEFLERLDHQVKVRGFRIELGEIEALLHAHPAVSEAAVVVEKRTSGDPSRLVACVVASSAADPAEELRAWLRRRLPDYMVPAGFLALEALPRTASGKVDRGALARRAGERRPETAAAAAVPRGETERAVAEIWKEVLGVDAVGTDENFFDVGGDSLLLARVHSKLRDRLGAELTMPVLFRHTTIRSLAGHLRREDAGESDHLEGAERARARTRARHGAGSPIAILSMALRLPGAETPEQFWDNLIRGVESITFFSDEDCLAAGADPEMLTHPDYVRAEAVLDGVELFDADLFGITPREAELIDPQQRFLLELGWEALERAGYGTGYGRGAVGVFLGAAMSSYMFNNLSGFRAVNIMTDFQTRVMLFTGNEKDFHAQKLSYLLKLDGPSVNVQTACSSAVVSVHLAVQSLLSGECDMALAGGAQIRTPQKIGYLYQEGGLPSPDGHCRPFDARAMGTLHSNGAGLVLLKRLDDALADGDAIHAVLNGSAVNNDAHAKVGFTAPSLEGIVRVAAEAHGVSGVDPATLGFVEAHGTGTDLGDSLEVEALTRVFRAYTEGREYCLLGSVKSNLGHLDTAAGIGGLAKAALALEHGEIPPTLHFETPNPNIPFAETPFKVNAEPAAWPRLPGTTARRAAVNVFAIGGTNAYMVLEEAPAARPSGASRPRQLLALSARTTTGLHCVSRDLARWLRENRPDAAGLADVAFTLSHGRQAFGVRRAVLAASADDALDALDELEPPRVHAGVSDGNRRPVAFAVVLPDGPQAGGLAAPAAELHRREPVFRRAVERIAEASPQAGPGALASLVSGAEPEAWARDTPLARLARFAFAEALGRLWMAWGIEPELVAAAGESAAGRAAAGALAGRLGLTEAAAAAAQGSSADGPETPLEELFARPEQVLLEIGGAAPGLADYPERPFEQAVVRSVPPAGPLDAVPLTALAELWSLGVEVAWPAFWEDEDRRRVRLPIRPFERQRYWIDPPADPAPRRETAAPGSAAARFYVPSWQRRLPGPAAACAGEPWLLFDDGSPFAEACAGELGAAGARLARVVPGPAFARDGDRFTVDPAREEHYLTLASELAAEAATPRRVLHLWSLAEGDPAALGCDSLVGLARALDAVAAGAEVEIGVVTEGVREVDGNEPLEPRRAAVLAPVRVLPRELPQLSVWCVDVTGAPRGAGEGRRLAARLRREFGRPEHAGFVAYRGSFRWEEAWEELDPAMNGSADDADGERTYLITDNGFGFGLEIAEHLARGDRAAGRRARLAFLGPALPERRDWESHLAAHGDAHPVSRSIHRLQVLEQKGGEVLVRRVELGDAAAVRAAVRSCREAWGGLHGVVHGAADLAGPVPILGSGKEDWEPALERLAAAHVLAAALDAEELSPRLEFCLLLSSLRGVFGSAGGVAAAAADFGLDLLARRRTRAGGGVWRTVGWHEALLGGDGTDRLFGSGGADGENATRGPAALLRLLVSPDEEIGQVVVSPHPPATPASVESDSSGGEQETGETSRRPRPRLGTPYAPPEYPLESEILEVWEEIFGLESLGIDDDFYELGGHSLLAVRMVNRLRESMRVDLLLREALEVSTVRRLAVRVAEKQVAAAAGADLEKLLDDLEAISEEEALGLVTTEVTSEVKP